MDRLTVWEDNKRGGKWSYHMDASVNDLCAKLAAYEDTGLMPDEIEALKQREQFLTEAYDRNAEIHKALTRDYLAAKARAEAAEADMKRMADDMDGETDACYPCAICAKNNSRCDTSDNCFEWRGPQEGAAE